MLVSQGYTSPSMFPTQASVAGSLHTPAAAGLGTSTGHPAQMTAIAGPVPSHFQSSYGQQPVPTDMSYFRPVPREQWAPDAHVSSPPLRETGAV